MHIHTPDQYFAEEIDKETIPYDGISAFALMHGIILLNSMVKITYYCKVMDKFGQLIKLIESCISDISQFFILWSF